MHINANILDKQNQGWKGLHLIHLHFKSKNQNMLQFLLHISALCMLYILKLKFYSIIKS